MAGKRRKGSKSCNGGAKKKKTSSSRRRTNQKTKSKMENSDLKINAPKASTAHAYVSKHADVAQCTVSNDPSAQTSRDIASPTTVLVNGQRRRMKSPRKVDPYFISPSTPFSKPEEVKSGGIMEVDEENHPLSDDDWESPPSSPVRSTGKPTSNGDFPGKIGERTSSAGIVHRESDIISKSSADCVCTGVVMERRLTAGKDVRRSRSVRRPREKRDIVRRSLSTCTLSCTDSLRSRQRTATFCFLCGKAGVQDPPPDSEEETMNSLLDAIARIRISSRQQQQPQHHTAQSPSHTHNSYVSHELSNRSDERESILEVDRRGAEEMHDNVYHQNPNGSIVAMDNVVLTVRCPQQDTNHSSILSTSNDPPTESSFSFLGNVSVDETQSKELLGYNDPRCRHTICDHDKGFEPSLELDKDPNMWTQPFGHFGEMADRKMDILNDWLGSDQSTDDTLKTLKQLSSVDREALGVKQMVQESTNQKETELFLKRSMFVVSKYVVQSREWLPEFYPRLICGLNYFEMSSAQATCYLSLHLVGIVNKGKYGLDKIWYETDKRSVHRLKKLVLFLEQHISTLVTLVTISSVNCPSLVFDQRGVSEKQSTIRQVEELKSHHLADRLLLLPLSDNFCSTTNDWAVELCWSSPHSFLPMLLYGLHEEVIYSVHGVRPSSTLHGEVKLFHKEDKYTDGGHLVSPTVIISFVSPLQSVEVLPSILRISMVYNFSWNIEKAILGSRSKTNIVVVGSYGDGDDVKEQMAGCLLMAAHVASKGIVIVCPNKSTFKSIADEYKKHLLSHKDTDMLDYRVFDLRDYGFSKIKNRLCQDLIEVERKAENCNDEDETTNSHSNARMEEEDSDDLFAD